MLKISQKPSNEVYMSVIVSSSHVKDVLVYHENYSNNQLNCEDKVV